VGRNHGYGIQWLHPLVTITWPDGTAVLYGPVTADDAAIILDEATGRTAHGERLAIGTLAGERAGVPSIREHPFFACEPAERRILSNMGYIDPDSMEHYVARGGWSALARILYRGQQPEAIRQELIDAALTGRGGASFPAGVKWNFLAGAPGEEHYMVCNADEGDPGAWVNRVVLEGDPHLLIEGMTIAAFATASKRGFIYIREEYPLGVERVELAVRQAEAAGLLGDHILGTDFSFQLDVVKGAGAYVCGEETGLLSSIQDDRGMPRVKPPFPAQAGVFMKPSNVNNVETYANAPFVMRHGHEWYVEEGTEAMRGTRIFSFSGDIERAGFMELAFGTPVADVLEACGGIIDGGELKAIQSGGPLGSLVPGSALPTLVFENASFAPYDAIMGAGGIVWVSDRTSLVILNELFSWFVEEESCGRCTTCHGGNQRMTEIFRRIMAGGGRREDAINLKLLDDTLQSSNCVHGQFSPKIMRNLLQHFREDYDTLVLERRDPTLTIAGMTVFRVANSRDPKVEEAVAICPADAFRGTPGNRTIDDEACVRCGACTDVAPGAIVRRPKEHATAPMPVA
jgi:NADH-quinone oxidoreductase subunit F